MEAASTVVIKVKYGDTLRRFNALIVNEKLNLTTDGLKEKISSLFSFSPDTEQTLTYIDEDGDVVTLADDEDLHDVVKQDLNPLRITVTLKPEKNGRQFSRSSSSGSSAPLRSPPVQQNSPNPDLSEILKTVQEPLREALLKSLTDLASKSLSSAPVTTQDLNSGLSQILRTVQEPLRETLKLTTDAASKSATAVPAVAELVDKISKASLSYVDQLSVSKPKEQPSAQNDAPESSKRKEGSSMERANEVKIGNSTSSSKASGPNAVPSSVAPKTINLGKKKLFMRSIDHSSDEKSSASVDLPSVAKNIPAEKEVNKPSNPNSEPKIASAGVTNPVKGDSLGDRLQRAYYGAPGSAWAPSTGGSNFPGCPFSGIPVGGMSGAPVPASQYVGSGVVFHRGVRCDGCGTYPITGPRFKSKVKVNYDLCEICFSGTGNDREYIRMDFPAAYHTHKSFRGLLNKTYRMHQHGAPTIPHVCRILKDKSGHSKLNSRFIQDVNVIDGTVMAPLTPFTKIWRMRNNGTAVWPAKTQLVWIGGDRLCDGISFEVEIPESGIQVDQELDVAVDFVAPERPGRYISYWRMSSPSGQKFGQRFWVLIQVDASLKENRGDGVRGFNLNFLPVSDDTTGPAIIVEDIEELIAEDALPQQPDNNYKKAVVESAELLPNVDHEKKFPINDSLLVGSGASTSVSSSGPSISYPTIDLPYGELVFPSVIPPAVASAPPPPATAVTPEAFEVAMEEKLLKELENMGFKQVDLNKEVLRLNEYDLANTVDELCGVSEWDPMLEELEEMGFTDTEMNKMLLKKNNGSIKRVVMDLIAGEKKYD